MPWCIVRQVQKVLNDFSNFLPTSLRLFRLVIIGDFNIHIDDTTDSFAISFINLIDSFNFTQHVSGPKHSRGQTLDFVFTHVLSVDAVCSDDIFLTYHHCIFFMINESVPHSVACWEVSSCFLNTSTGASFAADFTLVFFKW